MPAEIKDWLNIVTLVIAIGSAVYAWLTSGAKKTAAALDSHKTETNKQLAELVKLMSDQERRIQSLENDMRHLPDREHAHRMELAIEKLTGVTKTLESQLSGRMDALDERLKPVAGIADRLQEFLLEQARK